ncbi:MAG: hypothetical protein FJ116_12885 [Deltaproteobacteria bacterium]|nr:hypothetical protein [Deltaproteobacteria bacterium]MBM4318352.1 hypothetical protein [Deltaproteobacteria bacterium]
MRSLFLGIMAISTSLWAAHPICVRHYAEKDGVDVCERFPDAYAYLAPLKAELQKPICARVYMAFYCEQSANVYEYVESLNKGRICVLNDNQPPVSRLCETVPQFYEYIKEKSED